MGTMATSETAPRIVHPVREFSDSYHLLSLEPKDRAQLLRRAGRFGAVFPATGRFAALLVEGLAEAGEPCGTVVAQNIGTLIHYAFTEDDGCRIHVFGGSALLASLHFMGGGASFGIQESISILRQHAIVDKRGAALLVDVALHPEIRAIGALMAAALGLDYTSRLSCANLTYGWTTLPRRYPGLHFVNRAKRVGGPPKVLCG
jgi:hypothetical protein